MQRRGSGPVAQKPCRSTWGNSRETMPYNLAQAGTAVGRNRSTILKAIRRGAISATRDEATGGWLIEPAELHRVFPPVAVETSGNAQGNAATPGATTETGEVRELRARLDAAERRFAGGDETIGDLRHGLDRADEERRRAQVQMAALLTDQRQAAPPAPPQRSWWPWGRRA